MHQWTNQVFRNVVYLIVHASLDVATKTDTLDVVSYDIRRNTIISHFDTCQCALSVIDPLTRADIICVRKVEGGNTIEMHQLGRLKSVQDMYTVVYIQQIYFDLEEIRDNRLAPFGANPDCLAIVRNS